MIPLKSLSRSEAKINTTSLATYPIAGMGQFVAIVTHKAEEAGRTAAKINPRKTSQLCSQCHKQGPHKDLEERVHLCPSCGVVLDRDTNAALNILTAWKRPTLWARLCGKRDQGVEVPCL